MFQNCLQMWSAMIPVLGSIWLVGCQPPFLRQNCSRTSKVKGNRIFDPQNGHFWSLQPPSPCHLRSLGWPSPSLKCPSILHFWPSSLPSSSPGLPHRENGQKSWFLEGVPLLLRPKMNHFFSPPELPDEIPEAKVPVNLQIGSRSSPKISQPWYFTSRIWQIRPQKSKEIAFLGVKWSKMVKAGHLEVFCECY